jgi:hypothetical protein
MKEKTAWTIVASVAVISITVLGGYGCHQTEKTRQEAIKAGLVEDFQPGFGRIWTKPNNQ